MSHAPFSPGDKVEYAGYRLGAVVRGPERRHAQDGWYLVQCLNPGPGDGTLPDWYPEHMLELADLLEWVPAVDDIGLGHGRWMRRPIVRHLSAAMAGPGQPLLCCGKQPRLMPGRDVVTRDPAKVNCGLRKPAARHYCRMRDYPGSGSQHTAGDGTPTRRFCAGCHGELVTEHGLWGVFRWRGDGRYPWEDAICTYTRAGLASERATSDEAKQDDPEHGGWVVRWIPLGS